ncbi:variable surface protein [Plasmodium gonderi]|uniref:Variable surface protein n=1 Tax=Plasmodium gonderi TaxID=77519 RepID=A0A1Y1JSW4_PLAGO|nr:variable surface protein [Plasmodium gonderi]GAW84545.1 variable surface protein [Plasmodium gonderi]
MKKSIYEIVEKFPECNEHINTKQNTITSGGTNNVWEILCLKPDTITTINKHSIDYSGKVSEICVQAMEYLHDVNLRTEEFLKDAGCAYFYYWIFDVAFNKNMSKINDIPYLFNEFTDLLKRNILALNSSGKLEIPINELCLYSQESIIKRDFQKIIYIYNLYDIINSKGGKINKDVFKQIVNIVKQYNENMESVSCKIVEIPDQPTCKNNILVPIIITMIVTFLISLFIFILLKFTTLGSLIQGATLIRRNVYDNIDEELSRFRGSDIYGTMSRNSVNNILYNSK